MASFRDNLRRLQRQHGVRNVAIVQALGVTAPMVSKWRGGVVPNNANLHELAALLKTTPQELLGDSGRDPLRQASTGQPSGTEAEDFDRDIARGYKKNDVPIVGDAEASANGIIAWDGEGLVRGQIEHWVSRAFSDGDPRAYALRVRGDSMVPRFFPGEIIVAQPREPVQDGHYAVVMLTTDERLVKRVFRTNGGWRLHSENHLYPERTVADDEVVAIHRIRHSMQM